MTISLVGTAKHGSTTCTQNYSRTKTRIAVHILWIFVQDYSLKETERKQLKTTYRYLVISASSNSRMAVQVSLQWAGLINGCHGWVIWNAWYAW